MLKTKTKRERKEKKLWSHFHKSRFVSFFCADDANKKNKNYQKYKLNIKEIHKVMA